MPILNTIREEQETSVVGPYWKASLLRKGQPQQAQQRRYSAEWFADRAGKQNTFDQSVTLINGPDFTKLNV